MSLEFHGVRLPRHNFTLTLDVNIDDDVTGVFGHSGAGKTSLLHLIAGLERPSAGRLSFNGRVFFDVKKHIWVPPHLRRIGMVFQHARLFPHLNVRKNLLFASSFMAEKPDRKFFNEVVDLLELAPLLEHAVTRISGGEAQRTALGRVLLSKPELLLLDEPFSAIDMTLRRQILPFLWRIRRHFNIPMLIISHDLPDILRLTDKLLLMDKGNVAGKGSLTELVMEHNLLSAAGHAAAINVFDLTISAIENEDSVVMSANTGQAPKFYGLARPGMHSGMNVKAAIAPEDILISIRNDANTSARNIISGKIVNFSDHPARSFCRIDIGGGQNLLAEITRDSLHRLGLQIGSEVFCIFKASSLDIIPDNGATGS